MKNIITIETATISEKSQSQKAYKEIFDGLANKYPDTVLLLADFSKDKEKDKKKEVFTALGWKPCPGVFNQDYYHKILKECSQQMDEIPKEGYAISTSVIINGDSHDTAERKFFKIGENKPVILMNYPNNSYMDVYLDGKRIEKNSKSKFLFGESSLNLTAKMLFIDIDEQKNYIAIQNKKTEESEESEENEEPRSPKNSSTFFQSSSSSSPSYDDNSQSKIRRTTKRKQTQTQ